jgi:hypothetical protein
LSEGLYEEIDAVRIEHEQLANRMSEVEGQMDAYAATFDQMHRLLDLAENGRVRSRRRRNSKPTAYELRRFSRENAAAVWESQSALARGGGGPTRPAATAP